MVQEINRLTDQKDREMSEQIDNYDRTIAALTAEYTECKVKFLALTEIEGGLRLEFDTTCEKLEEKIQEVHKREKDARKLG